MFQDPLIGVMFAVNLIYIVTNVYGWLLKRFFVPDAYPITYNLNGGSVVTANPATYTYETPTFTLNNPTKLGYGFNGWTGSNGNTPLTTVTITNHSHGNKNYTANWTANTYSIRFNANDGTGAIVDLYAQWSVHHYTVHFDKNKEEANGTMADQNFIYDQGSLNANAFTCTGYTFNGWNTEANGSGTSYTDQQATPNVIATNNATVTLYAQWTPISYTVHFDANYDNNGIVISGAMSNQNFNYDQAQTLTTNAFERTGYTFTRWNTEPDERDPRCHCQRRKGPRSDLGGFRQKARPQVGQFGTICHFHALGEPTVDL